VRRCGGVRDPARIEAERFRASGYRILGGGIAIIVLDTVQNFRRHFIMSEE